MTGGRRIAIVKSYDELLAALRARALELGATRKQIAEVAGLPDGYAATLLAPQPIRALGRTSLGPMLGALGLMLIVVEDEEAWARVKSRVGGGRKSYMLSGAENKPVIFKMSRRFMRKMAHLSVAARLKKIPPWKRRSIARRAARARWRKHAEASSSVAGKAPGTDAGMVCEPDGRGIRDTSHRRQPSKQRARKPGPDRAGRPHAPARDQADKPQAGAHEENGSARRKGEIDQNPSLEAPADRPQSRSHPLGEGRLEGKANFLKRRT